MTYPPDAAMFTLLGFHLREKVVILDGQPALWISAPGFMGNTLYRIVITEESLDALEARKWIDLSQDQPRVTKLGREAVKKWIVTWKNKWKRAARPATQRQVGL